jgi:uncharacterized linocin/CFP29 family protein
VGDDGHRLPWTDEQWAAVQRMVQDAANRARVASSFLPLVGPLAPGQATVPALRMTDEPLDDWRGLAKQRLEVDDGATLQLTTISCNVYLTTLEAEDPELAAAHQMLGRAADIIGRLEDAIVFNGRAGEKEAPKVNGDLAVAPDIYTVRGDYRQGLLTHPGILTQDVVPHQRYGFSNGLVDAVVDAVQKLEKQGHYGPFVCVLGHGFYKAANTPNRNSLVLPSDRIVPFLDRPLLRSGTMPNERGVVIGLSGSPVDMVVARDVHVTYLQLSVEPRHVLRVSERFVLRIKQPTAVCVLSPGAPPTGAPPTGAPPTGAPPTGAPPTGAPPTDAPPTDAPPTDAPPTDAPPTP